VDLGVPNIAQALAVLLVSGLQAHRSSQTIVVDPETTFEVRLHAGGSVPSELVPAN
jgi:DNA invertase Pin-like site-specific DNA recombinase